jgi:hypothetical protein
MGPTTAQRGDNREREKAQNKQEMVKGTRQTLSTTETPNGSGSSQKQEGNKIIIGK